jgi:beta-glucosidase
VRRILTRKFELGLFEHPFTDRTNLPQVGSAGHRALARTAVAESQVLLKNRGVLPLSGHERIYVAGSNADDIGNQAGGWTVQWQGQSGDIIPGNTILEGIHQVAPGAQVTFSEDASAPAAGNDVGIVVVGETPYAEGFGDVGGPLWQTTACRGRRRTCGCRPPTGPPSTGSAAPSTGVWCWWSPAGR